MIKDKPVNILKNPLDNILLIIWAQLILIKCLLCIKKNIYSGCFNDKKLVSNWLFSNL
jgi:hypothetical protein